MIKKLRVFMVDANGWSPSPGGLLTNTTVRYPDGRARYTEQNGIRQTTYSYGPHSPSAPPPVTPQTARYHAPRVRPDPPRTEKPGRAWIMADRLPDIC
jgi:hypothetical protein